MYPRDGPSSFARSGEHLPRLGLPLSRQGVSLRQSSFVRGLVLGRSGFAGTLAGLLLAPMATHAGPVTKAWYRFAHAIEARTSASARCSSALTSSIPGPQTRAAAFKVVTSNT